MTTILLVSPIFLYLATALYLRWWHTSPAVRRLEGGYGPSFEYSYLVVLEDGREFKGLTKFRSLDTGYPCSRRLNYHFSRAVWLRIHGR